MVVGTSFLSSLNILYTFVSIYVERNNGPNSHRGFWVIKNLTFKQQRNQKRDVTMLRLKKLSHVFCFADFYLMPRPIGMFNSNALVPIPMYPALPL